MRKGWVFCGGMIRSGSTLQYQLASELIERFSLGERTTYFPPEEHARVLESVPHGLSTFKTHSLTEPVALHCQRGGGIALYIYRDLRDVVSSFQQKERVRLEGDVLADFIIDLIRKDLAWRSLPQVHVSRYEDVVFALDSEVIRIGEFLDIPCSSPMAEQIAEDLSYTRQAEGIASADREDLVEVNSTNVYHRNTLLHKNHFQGGAAGRYKSDLDPGQCRVIEDQAGAWLAANNYVLTT